MSSSPPKASSTVAQLKADIDSGRTGDKVANSDPGLSPLGTDDEAGGTPPTPERIEMARRQEACPGLSDSEAPAGLRGKWLTPTIMIAVIAVIAVLLVGAVFVLR